MTIKSQTSLPDGEAPEEQIPTAAELEAERIPTAKEDARASVLNAIKDARVQNLREDGWEIPEEDDDGEEQDDGVPAGDPETQEPSGEETEDAQMVEIVVDGQKTMVSVDDLKANYQMDSAARARLTEASAALNRAQEAERYWMNQAQTVQPEPTGDTGGEETAADLDERYAAVVKGLQYGETDEGVAALKDLVNDLRQQGAPEVTAGGTDAEIEFRVMERIEWNTALGTFGDEYSDILSNSSLAKLAGAIASETLAESYEDSRQRNLPRESYLDIFRRAGERTRETIRGYAGATDSDTRTDPSKTVVDLSPERVEGKTASKTPSPRRKSSVPEGTATPRPKTEAEKASDAVAAMRKARGQAA